MPRIARRVVCGRIETIATWLPTICVDQGRLADVGAAGEPDEAGAAHASPASTSGLQGEHLASVGLVVVAAEVEDAVHGGLGHVGAVLGADRHVAELARAGRRARPVDREGEHVGGRVLSPVLAVELADARGIDQLDREMAVLDPRRGERSGNRLPQLRRHVGEVEAQERGVGPCSARAARSRLPCSS